jgi:hypothetical protein
MTDAHTAGPRATAEPTHAPIDLDTIKDDLNIIDDSQDAWLQRRLDGVWARMESFCGRKLCAPPLPFVDDWGEITINGEHVNRPPLLAYWPRASVFLRVHPVAEITAIELYGSSADPAQALFDIDSGKLFTVTAGGTVGAVGWARGWEYDLGRELLSARARVSYMAGWATVPADLYEAALGAVQVLWTARQAQLAGLGGGAVTSIDVMDVGSVQLAGANSFVDAATKRGIGGTVDPLLGPWLAVLNDYIDWRATLGADALPTTKEGTAEGSAP